MERSMGLEPTPGPWQGPVLPLYYDRPETGKLYHVIRAATRSYRARKNTPNTLQWARASYDALSWIARNSALFDLADLKHARCLYDGRFPLPFSELGGFGTVCINTGKFLSVFVKNRNLPVLVLASSVFAELGAFSLFQ
jgi:hypothetical protein